MDPIKIANPKIFSGTGNVLSRLKTHQKQKLSLLVFSVGIAVGAMVTNMVEGQAEAGIALPSAFAKPYDFIDENSICGLTPSQIPFQVEFNNNNEAFTAHTIFLASHRLFPERVGKINIDKGYSLVSTRAINYIPEIHDLTMGIIDRHELENTGSNTLHIMKLVDTYLTDAMAKQYGVDRESLNRHAQCFVFNHELMHARIIKRDMDNSVETESILTVFGHRTHSVLHEYLADSVAIKKSLYDIAHDAKDESTFQNNARAFMDLIVLFRSFIQYGDVHIGGTLAAQENDLALTSMTRDHVLVNFTDEKLLADAFQMTDKWNNETQGDLGHDLIMDVEKVDSEFGRSLLIGAYNAKSYINDRAKQIGYEVAAWSVEQSEQLDQCPAFDRSIKSSIECFREKQARNTNQPSEPKV